MEIIYTKFITLVSCAPVVQTLLPLDPQGIAEENDEIFRLTTKDSKLLVEKSNIEKSDSEKLPSDIVFEQSPDQLLDSLRDQTKFSNWIFVIARNKCRAHLKGPSYTAVSLSEEKPTYPYHTEEEHNKRSKNL